MQAAYVRLRLQAVTTNACRKFHLDAITGRLVCTYRGPGTQYGTSTAGEDPEHIRTVPTGAPHPVAWLTLATGSGIGAAASLPADRRDRRDPFCPRSGPGSGLGRSRMNGNLGQTSLRRKRRCGDPMMAFDGLPAPGSAMGVASRPSLVPGLRAPHLVPVAGQRSLGGRGAPVAHRGPRPETLARGQAIHRFQAQLHILKEKFMSFFTRLACATALVLGASVSGLCPGRQPDNLCRLWSHGRSPRSPRQLQRMDVEPDRRHRNTHGHRL